jgi:hypothetical protein
MRRTVWIKMPLQSGNGIKAISTCIGDQKGVTLIPRLRPLFLFYAYCGSRGWYKTCIGVHRMSTPINWSIITRLKIQLTFHPTALKAEAPCERGGLKSVDTEVVWRRTQLYHRVCGTSCVRFVQQEVFTPSLVSLLRCILYTTNSNFEEMSTLLKCWLNKPYHIVYIRLAITASSQRN